MTLERIDEVCGRPFRAVLHGLCYITGQTNFFFARLALLLGLISFASYTAVNRSWVFGLFTVLFALIAVAELHMYARVEQELKQSSGDILPSFLAKVGPQRQLSRVAALCGTALMVALGLVNRQYILLAIAWLCDAAALYFSIEITPRGKSIIRRAVDWVKAHAPRLNPAPAPRPELA